MVDFKLELDRMAELAVVAFIYASVTYNRIFLFFNNSKSNFCPF